MDPKQELTLEALRELIETMHLQSPDALRAIHDRLLAAITPEAQENFRTLQEQAQARPQRPRLQNLSAAGLRALHGEELDQAVFEFVAEKLDDTDSARAKLLDLPRALQVFYLSFVLEVEVLNGGLGQFFWNSCAAWSDLMAPALCELGAPEAADIFEQAWRVARDAASSTGASEDRSWEAFAEYSDQTDLDTFDAPLVALVERFPSLRETLVRAHEEQFLERP